MRDTFSIKYLLKKTGGLNLSKMVRCLLIVLGLESLQQQAFSKLVGNFINWTAIESPVIKPLSQLW